MEGGIIANRGVGPKRLLANPSLSSIKIELRANPVGNKNICYEIKSIHSKIINSEESFVNH